MAKKFQPDDVVQLLSGGPELTIEDYKRDLYTHKEIFDQYVVVWIDDNKQPHRDTYKEGNLKLIRGQSS